VVGNVVTASPANDTISALVALRASVRLQSTRTERVVPVEEFVRGYRTVDLEADELVVALEVPTLSADRRGLFVKLGNRAQQAISVVHGAIVLTFDGALVVDASIALGSVGATVVRVIDAERCLIGRRLDDAVIARAADAAAASVRPLSDVRATADYRTSTTRLLLRRALRTLATDASPVLEHLGAPKLRAATVMPPLSVPPLDGFGPVRAEVNGTEVASPGGSATLLDWLREGAGLTGTKEGCAEGECGACTVVMDGAAVLACLVPVGRAHGTRITTVEGLARDGAPSALQDAFVGCGAVQCGFCTPGFLVSGTVLLDERPRPRADDVVRGLAGNLCRCTGYRAIVDAVIAAAGEAGVR
jgi:carbon-monoxide dehydrogenase medium subunit